MPSNLMSSTPTLPSAASARFVTSSSVIRASARSEPGRRNVRGSPCGFAALATSTSNGGGGARASLAADSDAHRATYVAPSTSSETRRTSPPVSRRDPSSTLDRETQTPNVASLSSSRIASDTRRSASPMVST